MGPRCAIGRLSAYLEKQVVAGRLATDEDIELAAAHFLNLCQGNTSAVRKSRGTAA
jgi:hypothetical protein